MSAAHFQTMTRQQIQDGSWFEEARRAWRRGEIGLITLAPEASGDAELRAAIETTLASNGTYERGDRAVIHTRPAAVAMGCETAHLLQARGIEATVVLGMASMGREVNELLQAAHEAARDAATTLPPPGRAQQTSGGGSQGGVSAPASAGQRFDPSTADPQILAGVADGYRALLEPIAAQGRGHWIVPIGTAPDPRAEHVPGLDFYTKVAGRALAPIGQLRVDGQLRSHDIWLNPSELDVVRLNEDLPPERHWTLGEWRSLIFRAMAVGAEELETLAMEIEGVQLTVEASRKGGTLFYQREDGTDIRYEVRDRPVILDCGRIGINSLGGTSDYVSRITNQPTTEVFVAPIEDSMSGVILFTIPERTTHGIIRAPYRIEVCDGQVTGVRAPDEESVRILRNYTGLEPFDRRPLGGTAQEAFGMRRIIAEMAIAGFNPAMAPEIASGRLRPVTGLVLTDEKLGDHQAFGSNDQFRGATPSTYRDEHVEHTDFVGGVARMMRLKR
ncbi:MAG: hypothetical protein GF330_01045 [Candidatus Eisenbacteria bacterium]|nr:hypothetical protein [Candidatus Eisenbacteria bacterium]